MTFKVLALVVEQFWCVYRMCRLLEKYLFSEGDIFIPFCYKFSQV